MLYTVFYRCYSFVLARPWLFAVAAAWFALCFATDLIFNPYGRQTRQTARAQKDLERLVRTRRPLPADLPLPLPQAYASFAKIMKTAPQLRPSAYLVFEEKKPSVLKPLLCLVVSAALLPCTPVAAWAGTFNYMFYLPLFFAITFVAYVQTHFLLNLRRLLRAKKTHDDYLNVLDGYFARLNSFGRKNSFSASAPNRQESPVAHPVSFGAFDDDSTDQRQKRLVRDGLNPDSAQQVCRLLDKVDQKTALPTDYSFLNESLQNAFSLYCKNKEKRA